MKNTILVFLNLIFFSGAVLAQSLDYAKTYINRGENDYQLLEAIGGSGFFESKDQDTGEKICQYTSVITADTLDDAPERFSLFWQMTVFPQRVSMGVVETQYMGGVFKGNLLTSTEQYPALPYLKDSDGLQLFSPMPRFLASDTENKFLLENTKLETMGEISEFINSVRTIGSEAILEAIYNPETTRRSGDDTMLLFPFFLLMETVPLTYALLETPINIAEFLRFVDCSEKRFVETFRSPLMRLGVGGLGSSKSQFFECTGRDSVFNMQLPTLNWALGEEPGVATLIQGEETIDFSLADHSEIKVFMNLGSEQEVTRYDAYRWNNTDPALLGMQDKMFKGFDVYSRFVSAIFLRDEDGWKNLQLMRSLDYEPEILERNCEIKDKEWWEEKLSSVKYNNNNF